ERGRPVWFGGLDRSVASLNEFFAWLGPIKCGRIRLAVMDMWSAFRTSTLQVGNAPQATILQAAQFRAKYGKEPPLLEDEKESKKEEKKRSLSASATATSFTCAPRTRGLRSPAPSRFNSVPGSAWAAPGAAGSWPGCRPGRTGATAPRCP